MRNSDKIIINLDEPNIIIVNGKKYIVKSEKGKIMDGVLHGDKVVAVPFDENEYYERKEFIVNSLKHSITTQRVIEELLKHKTTNELKKIEKLLKSGAKVKRHDGCLGLKIGNGRGSAYLSVFD